MPKPKTKRTPKTSRSKTVGCSSAEAAILNAPIRFGLRAQGHTDKIARMLKEGCGWTEIADAIGWCRGKARSDYERLQRPAATRDLRQALAEAVEVIRRVRKVYGKQLTADITNRMAEAYLHGTTLLKTKTYWDFYAD